MKKSDTLKEMLHELNPEKDKVNISSHNIKKDKKIEKRKHALRHAISILELMGE